MRHWAKILALGVGGVLAVAIATIAWVAMRARDPTHFAAGTRVDLANYEAPDPTGVPPALAGADAITRGQYLTRAADCVACHTAPGGKRFAGGRAFRLPFGTLYSSNITPDSETGIGDWSDEDFVAALHEGASKDGKYLYPAFPYPSYTLLTRKDVLAIKEYLFTFKPVRYVPPENDLAFPFNQRYLMQFWNLVFNPDRRFQPNAGQSAEWNRGAYLSEALGHCGDCHTPRNLLQGLSSSRKFAGGVIEGWKAYNITPDPVWGIGDWSDGQLMEYVATGHAQGRSSAAGPMGEAVDNSLRFLTNDDIRAMIAYLKSVPPISDYKSPAAVRSSSAEAQATRAQPAAGNNHDLGLHTFESACLGCHSFGGSGAVWPHASLVGNRSVNDPEAVNLTQVLFQGAQLHTLDGPVFMPAFGAAYSDAEISAVANYVTRRFGTSASAITPDEVAKRRQRN